MNTNLTRFSGFADHYDNVRPQPPAMLCTILTQWIGQRPARVVDIGSGTGLSTRLWAEHADEVIGVEPNADMRGIAEARTTAPNVRYVEGVSTAIPLPDNCADIVMVSQALHWMEPNGTFAEVARVLRPGGVFAAVDCDWPPIVNPDVEMAYERCWQGVQALEDEHHINDDISRWEKEEHLGRMQASGRFRYCREILLHHQEMGDANRFVGVLTSQGGIAGLLRQSVSEKTIGIDELRRVAQETIGATPVPWWWSYRVRVGVV